MQDAPSVQSCLIDGVGLWAHCPHSSTFAGRPAVFLDRDGVLVEEVHFLARAADVRLTADVGPAVRALNRLSIAVIVVTNQSGIARGHFGWEAFAEVQAEIDAQLARCCAVVDATFACGYHASGSEALAAVSHPWRKPSDGMLREAHKRLAIDLRRSVMVGDRLSDVEAGMAAGLAGATLVMTGYGLQHRARTEAASERWKEATYIVTTAENAAVAIGSWLPRLAACSGGDGER